MEKFISLTQSGCEEKIYIMIDQIVCWYSIVLDQRVGSVIETAKQDDIEVMENPLQIKEKIKDAQSQHLSPDMSLLIPACYKFLKKGEKIKAIALYRKRTGVGLAEAKQFVENLDI